jgi:hypothetical protein
MMRRGHDPNPDGALARAARHGIVYGRDPKLDGALPARGNP